MASTTLPALRHYNRGVIGNDGEFQLKFKTGTMTRLKVCQRNLNYGYIKLKYIYFADLKSLKCD